jgi:peptidoglycan/LPS O-acetylase OafA/YrhL
VGTISLAAMAAWWPPVPGELNRAYFYPHTRAWELLAGCALAAFAPRLVPRIGPRLAAAAGWGGVGLLLLAGAAATFVPRITALPMAVTCATAAAGTVLILVAAADGGGRVSRLLSVGPARRLGDWSYGMYLYHPAVIHLIQLIAPALPAVVLVPTVLSGTAGVAWCSRTAMELPVQHWVKGRLGRGRSHPADVPAVQLNVLADTAFGTVAPTHPFSTGDQVGATASTGRGEDLRPEPFRLQRHHHDAGE